MSLNSDQRIPAGIKLLIQKGDRSLPTGHAPLSGLGLVEHLERADVSKAVQLRHVAIPDVDFRALQDPCAFQELRVRSGLYSDGIVGWEIQLVPEQQGEPEFLRIERLLKVEALS